MNDSLNEGIRTLQLWELYLVIKSRRYWEFLMYIKCQIISRPCGLHVVWLWDAIIIFNFTFFKTWSKWLNDVYIVVPYNINRLEAGKCFLSCKCSKKQYWTGLPIHPIQMLVKRWNLYLTLFIIEYYLKMKINAQQNIRSKLAIILG